MDNNRKMLFADVYGDIGKYANFRKEILSLEKLNKLEFRLIKIYNSHNKKELIAFYHEIIKDIKATKKINSFQREILELSIATIKDLNFSEREIDIEDIFMAWDDLKQYFAGLNNKIDVISLSSLEYKKLIVYTSFLSDYEKDGENDFIFAYKILKEEHGDKIIEFYELEY